MANKKRTRTIYIGDEADDYVERLTQGQSRQFSSTIEAIILDHKKQNKGGKKNG